MLTGTVPFDGDSAVAVAVQHIQDSIPAPSQLVEGIPVSVDKIVLKCTQKKTDRRYQSASELIADLKKSLVMPDEDFVNLGSVYDGAMQSLMIQILKLKMSQMMMTMSFLQKAQSLMLTMSLMMTC